MASKQIHMKKGKEICYLNEALYEALVATLASNSLKITCLDLDGRKQNQPYFTYLPGSPTKLRQFGFKEISAHTYI